MPRILTVTESIDAPPARVWAVLAEFGRWPQWTASIRRIAPLQPTAPAVGAQVRIEQPRLLPATWTITDWQPPSAFTWVTRSPGVRIVAGHEIAARGPGSVVTLTVRFEGPFGGVAAALWGSLTRRYMAMEAAGLKRTAEAPSAS